MKYKRLSVKELQALEPEFINYLSTSQITAQDWVKMKEHEFLKAEELVDIFSDMVYDKVLKKINLLEYRDTKTLNIYNCLEEKIELIGLRAKELSTIDFTAADAFNNWTESLIDTIDVVKSEKKYIRDRELEIFELLQSGCFITDDRLFNALKSITESK